MNEQECIKFIEDLSYSGSEDTQKNAIKNLLNIPINYISLLIQADKKSTWPNAVLVMEEIGFPKNIGAISGLLFLMQDVNWSGVEEAFRVLKKMDKQVIIPHLEDAIIRASNEEDYMWIGGINMVVELLNITRIDFSKKELFELLKLADF